MQNASWKYLISYCVFLAVEVVFVCEWHLTNDFPLLLTCCLDFFFVETFGKTLEELSFIFEDKEVSDKAAEAVRKVIENDGAMSHDEKSSEDFRIEKVNRTAV